MDDVSHSFGFMSLIYLGVEGALSQPMAAETLLRNNRFSSKREGTGRKRNTILGTNLLGNIVSSVQQVDLTSV